jgi:DNA-nicking Smr family endonuclease
LLTRIFTRANIAVEEPLREIEVKPKAEDDDRALFREATRGVKPLAPTPRVTREAPKPRARARFARAGQAPDLLPIAPGAAHAPALAAADPTRFARGGVTQATLRKLRRGGFRIEAQLDLHGLTAAQAQQQLLDFLSEALRRNHRCLRIVHGKGLRSGSAGAVLRQLVNDTLRRTAQVLAIASAQPGDGGTGAVYVLLRSAPQASSASTTAD